MQDERIVYPETKESPYIEVPVEWNLKINKVASDTVPDVKVTQAVDFAVLITNAEKLIRHNELDLARGLVYKALSLDSKHPSAIRLAEKLLNPIQDIQKILTIRQNLCKVDYSFESVYSLAEIYYRLSDDQNAKKYYLEACTLVVDQLTSEKETLFEIYKNLGNIFTREADFDAAEEYYHRAFDIHPNSDALLVNLGTLELQQNEYNEAIDRFRKAIQINKRNDKAWVGLALVHNQMGDRSLALANIENAIECNPKNRTAVQVYANWAFQDGKYVHAIEVLQNYLSLHEVDEEISLVLIQFLSQMNRFDLAHFEIERVLLWNPKSERLSQLEKELRNLAREMK